MIINLFARELSGMSPTLWLLKSSDGTLTNVGGDALTESDHGHFVASVSESINELHYAFVTIAGVAVRDGWLVPGESLIRDTAPSSDLAQLDRIEAATSAATIADAVWDEARAGHVAAGSFGEGVATAANQTIMIDGIGFMTAQLMGACSDAGTSAETFQITFGGATYTLDFVGLDASGNRTGVTRTKT